MLFISRHIWLDNPESSKYSPYGLSQCHCYGVVDSDDGVEEVVGADDIQTIVREYGVDIAGVEYCDNYRNMSGRHPYQLNPSLVCVKTSLMKHIDVTVYGSMITGIKWNIPTKTLPTSIRLSDFGDSCADLMMFENLENSSLNGLITLIFDDNIQSIEPRALRLCGYGGETCHLGSGDGGVGMIVDLHEVHDAALASNIYQQLFAYSGNIFGHIIDIEERKHIMRQVWLANQEQW